MVGHLAGDCRSKEVAPAGLNGKVKPSKGTSGDCEKSKKGWPSHRSAHMVAKTPIWECICNAEIKLACGSLLQIGFISSACLQRTNTQECELV